MKDSEKRPMLPNAVAVLVLGICSIVVPCAGLVTGIVGWALSGTGLQIYRKNPTVWDGYSMLQAGRTLSIIGTIFNALYLLFYVLFMVLAIVAPRTIDVWDSSVLLWLVN